MVPEHLFPPKLVLCSASAAIMQHYSRVTTVFKFIANPHLAKMIAPVSGIPHPGVVRQAEEILSGT